MIISVLLCVEVKPLSSNWI
uniref:Uncharacterized protein n=1 Tax=Arundo donax TaxID=35708 RepID=A0A0A9CCK9_ARUDO